MSIALSQSPGLLKRFRRTSWKFQHTFVTPRQNLRPFVATICSTLQPLQAGAVTIDEVVFESTHLIALATTDSAPRLVHESTLSSAGAQETEALLLAALWDSPDFVFIPTPRPFVIYADHDEFCTFYAHTKSNLNRVVVPLSQQGFKSVEGWRRTF